MSIQANRLRERRKDLGMSQKTIAERINTNQAQISKYESGESSPSSEVLAELSRVLDVSTDWLLGLTDDTTPCLHEQDLSTTERSVLTAWRNGKRLKAIKTIVLDEPQNDKA